jgi:hypothetical protein
LISSVRSLPTLPDDFGAIRPVAAQEIPNSGRRRSYSHGVTAGGLATTRLLAVLRATESGSGTFLAHCTGGRYWVKAPNNPQGNHTLAAEVVVHGVGRLIGAPVCENILVELPAGLDFSYAPGHRLRAGVGHGSRDVSPSVVSEAWTTYLDRDDNQKRQARLAALWDLCMGGDPQWLHDEAHDYTIWSFDHGFWLGGGDGDWSPNTLAPIGTTPWHHDGIDPAVTSGAELRAAARTVGGLTRTAIRDVTRQVPVEWNIPMDHLDWLADFLALRADAVAERLEDAAASIERGGSL